MKRLLLAVLCFGIAQSRCACAYDDAKYDAEDCQKIVVCCQQIFDENKNAYQCAALQEKFVENIINKSWCLQQKQNCLYSNDRIDDNQNTNSKDRKFILWFGLSTIAGVSTWKIVRYVTGVNDEQEENDENDENDEDDEDDNIDLDFNEEDKKFRLFPSSSSDDLVDQQETQERVSGCLLTKSGASTIVQLSTDNRVGELDRLTPPHIRTNQRDTARKNTDQRRGGAQQARHWNREDGLLRSLDRPNYTRVRIIKDKK